MKFKVSRRDLEAALQVVSGCLGKDSADITSHYTFCRRGEDGKHTMEVLTYTGRLFSSSPLVGVAFDDPGKKGKTAFTVEGWRLKQWLQFVPDDGIALTFTFEDGEVTVRASRGKQVFQSLDPSTFPHWDKTLKESKRTAALPADRLAAALNHSRMFAAAKESSQNPGLSVCEVRGDGLLCSSDRKAAALVRCKGLTESTLRLHVQDVPEVVSFLSLLGAGEVEVWEHDRMMIFRRASDGAVFGSVRFIHAFPNSSVNMDDTDHHRWKVPVADLQQIIGFLESGASKNDNRLTLVPGSTAGEVIFSMVNTTGKTTELPLAGVEMESAPNAEEVPSEGFILDHRMLSKVLGTWKDPVITLGLAFRGDRGFVRILYEQHESKFLTLLSWLH